MQQDYQKPDELAAGAICPSFGCGVLVVICRARDVGTPDHLQAFEFTCGRCGFDFLVPEEELVFQSMPKNWLMFGVHAA
jgi:hypothetical protein